MTSGSRPNRSAICSSLPALADSFLPYGRQTIDDADIAAVAEALRGDFLTTGPAVAAFEAEFARAVGAPHAVSCANGTAALHLAALAHGLVPGDVVIVPTLTFLATANAARYVGAEVCFADVHPDTGVMTPETLSRAAAAAGKAGTGRVKSITPVHLGGNVCDMPEIAGIARHAGWSIVEDACHAVGGAGVGACTHSDMAVFSLHPVKTITAGEGGVVTTQQPALAERLARFRNHGMVRESAAFTEREQAFDAAGGANPWYYEMPEPGFNYRLTDIQAALANSQLKKLPTFVARRQALAARYDQALARLAPVVRPVPRAGTPALHLYAVLIDFAGIGRSRAEVMRRLRADGIGTQVHYVPVHRQPYYRARYGKFDLPGADLYYARTLSLPLFPAMADGDVDRVADALARAIE